MLNFTVGPVMSSETVLSIGAEQIPYFRTSEFSEIMFENERLIKKFANAGNNSRAVFITGSGTAAMEAAVINAFSEKDKLLVVNGGSFGQRFADICAIHNIPFEELRIDLGKTITAEMLEKYRGKGFTGLLVNIHETSTGVLYDIDIISKFCRENNIFLVVDTISSFLADEFDMQSSGTDIMIASSQKTLACPPGISIIVMSEKALERIEKNNVQCMYLNIKTALKDGERGQTPFTPAVGILLQINARLKEIEANGGAEYAIKATENIAEDFRKKINGLPLEIVSERMSNAVTPLHPLNVSANEIFFKLKDEYGIWICPNGGELRDKIFRVGHIGALTTDDNSKLVEAFRDLVKRNIL